MIQLLNCHESYEERTLFQHSYAGNKLAHNRGRHSISLLLRDRSLIALILSFDTIAALE